MHVTGENLSIALLSDENFAQHLCVALYSLLINNRHHNFIIYIIDGGIREQTKQKIEKSLHCFTNFSIQYIEFNTEFFNHFKSSKTISQVTYCRIMLPYLLPTLEKVLYLDCDILVHGDILELYTQGFDNKSLIAIQDRSDHYSSAFKNIYKIDTMNYCFNTGIMLMNFKKMRENKSVDKMIAFGENNKLLQLCMDQDLFNVEFVHDRKELPATRNAHQYFFIWSRNQFKDISDKEFYETRKNPKIIHFTGAKPRSSGYIHPFKKLYFTYLGKTEFKDFKVKFNLHTFIINLGTFLFLKFFSLLPRYHYLHVKKWIHNFNT